MSDEKKCPYCDKKLRIDNTRGACSACLAEGKPIPAGGTAPPKTVRRVEGESDEEETDAAAILAKFRTVAEALGFDPDEVLAEGAQAWLEGAGAAVKAANEAAED